MPWYCLAILSFALRTKKRKKRGVTETYKAIPRNIWQGLRSQEKMLRRSAALAYTKKWWAVLATGAQSAAIDCILGQDPQVWVPRGAPPLAVDLAWADVAPEPSRLG